MALFYLENQELDDSYDVAVAFVIRAEDEAEARKIASQDAGDEGSSLWLDPRRSSCAILSDKGESKVICRDFKSG